MIKVELEIPLGDDDKALEFCTHSGNNGDGCTISVLIDGRYEYEVTVYKDLRLQVKNLDSDKLMYEVDLQKHYDDELEGLDKLI